MSTGGTPGTVQVLSRFCLGIPLVRSRHCLVRSCLGPFQKRENLGTRTRIGEPPMDTTRGYLQTGPEGDSLHRGLYDF